MKKTIIIIFIFTAGNIYCQSFSKDTIYVSFRQDKDCSCSRLLDGKKSDTFFVKNEYDSIEFIKNKLTKNISLRKSQLDKKNKPMGICDLMDLEINDFLKLAETKQVFILVDKNENYEAIGINEIVYHERPQD